MKSEIFIGIWVDDIVICCENEDKANKFKHKIARKFQIDDCRQISEFLGMEFKYVNGQLCISQEKYVTKLLTEFGMMQCKAVTTRMALGKPVKSTKVCDMNSSSYSALSDSDISSHSIIYTSVLCQMNDVHSSPV